jgi:hypothetical protein
VKEIYTIEVDRPAGCDVEMMKYYIKTAVACWSGQFEPDHPLFNAFDEPNALKVRRLGPGGVLRTAHEKAT